jgi:dipeptidyl aminopeptidase/acylaminoacyl peptidase
MRARQAPFGRITVMTTMDHAKVPALLLAAVITALLAALALVPERAGAAFPGSNGRIAFYSQGDVWSTGPDGTAPTRLTTNINTEGDPAVSPDGSRIAYEFLRGIWVMNADGSAKKMLTSGTLTDENPAWSADGQKVAFSRNGDIWTMAADGTGQKNLTNNPENSERDPAYAPNGRIAYTRIGCDVPRGGGSCVYAMNADGSAQTNLTPRSPIPGCGPNYDNYSTSKEPVFSPDGSRIAFSGSLICPNTIGSDIWVMNADGSAKTNLINDNGTSDIQPAFSPDGQKIAFVSNRDGDADIYAMNAANGSGIMPITTNTTQDTDPDWAPLDVTAPRVITVTPPAGATAVAPAANVTATFSEAMKPDTLTRTTFKLVRRGTTAAVGATVTYDPNTNRAILNPTNNLAAATTYTATVTTGAKDTADTPLPANKTWNFRVR